MDKSLRNLERDSNPQLHKFCTIFRRQQKWTWWTSSLSFIDTRTRVNKFTIKFKVEWVQIPLGKLSSIIMLNPLFSFSFFFCILMRQISIFKKKKVKITLKRWYSQMVMGDKEYNDEKWKNSLKLGFESHESPNLW